MKSQSKSMKTSTKLLLFGAIIMLTLLITMTILLKHRYFGG